MAAQVLAQLALSGMRGRSTCLAYPTSVHAESVHFTPGLVEHLSWVDFSTPPSITGYFEFCLDGVELESGGGEELDFSGGHARFNVSTTWVNLVWFRGQLRGYSQLERWELRLLPLS